MSRTPPLFNGQAQKITDLGGICNWIKELLLE